MSIPRLLLHVGLPRTGTTSLQKHVFPEMKRIKYVGKAYGNKIIRGQFEPTVILKRALEVHKSDPLTAREDLMRLLDTLIAAIKEAGNDGRYDDMNVMAQSYCLCLNEIRDYWRNDYLLYSNEALIESSTSIFHAKIHRIVVPMEILNEYVLLEEAVVSVVLRNPASLIAASYYKFQEIRHYRKSPPLSFDSYIRHQIEIYLRKQSASRIFLCMQKPFVAHMKSYCPHLVVNHYENLVDEENVVDALFGFKTGEKPVRMKDLPRENTTGRYVKTRNYILSAPDVPKGISFDEYIASFTETLDHYGLNAIFAETSLRNVSPN